MKKTNLLFASYLLVVFFLSIVLIHVGKDISWFRSLASSYAKVDNEVKYQFLACVPSYSECFYSCPTREARTGTADENYRLCSESFAPTPIACFCRIESKQ